MSNQLNIAISTCPNDTFAFTRILLEKGENPLSRYNIQLGDIEGLNQMASAGFVGICKVSLPQAILLNSDFCLLPSGAAVGYGVGPLLLSGKSVPHVVSEHSRILVPGMSTTATYLFKRFFPWAANLKPVVFSSIMPMLQEGEADFGVVIHEGRFTFHKYGLETVEDLGARWERETQSPVPLGCLIAHRSLDQGVLEEFISNLRNSISFASENRTVAYEVMSQYSQEMEPEVIWKHVELYVNSATYQLGSSERRAIDHMASSLIGQPLSWPDRLNF